MCIVLHQHLAPGTFAVTFGTCTLIWVILGNVMDCIMFDGLFHETGTEYMQLMSTHRPNNL